MRGRPKKNKTRMTISIDDEIHQWLANNTTIRDKSNFFNVLAKQQINQQKGITVEESLIRDNIRDRQRKIKELIKILEKSEIELAYYEKKLDEEVARLKKIKVEAK